jgi:hypothetical protein
MAKKRNTRARKVRKGSSSQKSSRSLVILGLVVFSLSVFLTQSQVEQSTTLTGQFVVNTHDAKGPILDGRGRASMCSTKRPYDLRRGQTMWTQHEKAVFFNTEVIELDSTLCIMKRGTFNVFLNYCVPPDVGSDLDQYALRVRTKEYCGDYGKCMIVTPLDDVSEEIIGKHYCTFMIPH